MSTGLECLFIEISSGVWYMLLENSGSPKGAWDWREYATAYGPFPTLDEAEKYLFENHANPGGYGVAKYENGFKPDETLERLIREAIKPTPRRVGRRLHHTGLFAYSRYPN